MGVLIAAFDFSRSGCLNCWCLDFCQLRQQPGSNQEAHERSPQGGTPRTSVAKPQTGSRRNDEQCSRCFIVS